jgi:hypothetical protein
VIPVSLEVVDCQDDVPGSHCPPRSAAKPKFLVSWYLGASWRLHLVRHRSSPKQRVHAALLTHGKLCPVSDLFGVRGR